MTIPFPRNFSQKNLSVFLENIIRRHMVNQSRLREKRKKTYNQIKLNKRMLLFNLSH